MHADVTFIPPHLSAEQSSQWAQRTPALVYLVGSPHRLDGAITRKQSTNCSSRSTPTIYWPRIVDESFVHAHPDHRSTSCSSDSHKAAALLPVVSRTDARRVEGVDHARVAHSQSRVPPFEVDAEIGKLSDPYPRSTLAHPLRDRPRAADRLRGSHAGISRRADPGTRCGCGGCRGTRSVHRRSAARLRCGGRDGRWRWLYRR